MALAPFIAALFSRLNSFFSRSNKQFENASHALGRAGELAAAKYLRKNGFKVLYRNFRQPGGGELDIVCRDRETDELVFVEVKTRSTRDFGDPAEAVHAQKRDQIARGALAWLRLLGWPEIRYRFDIAEVVDDGFSRDVVLIKNAFTLPERYLT